MSQVYQCLKCGLQFGSSIPDYCPVCYTIPYVCPWCGCMTDASARLCANCGQQIKYVQVPPDNRDVMRLRKGEAVKIGNTTVLIEGALYAADRATVYRARVVDSSGGRKPDPPIGASVVLREVIEEWTPNSQALIAKLVQLKHPNIVRTYAGEPDSDRCCCRLLQAWIGERSLANVYLQEHGGIAAKPADLAKVSVTLAKAIEYLHSQGIIHCDVTPFNVLLKNDGTPVLSDFGIAVLSDDVSQPKGYASSYAPIELYPKWKLPSDLPRSDWAVGPHTDRYMLGTTLFAIACGHDGRTRHPITKTCVIVPALERARYDAGVGGMPQTPLRAFLPNINAKFDRCVETLISQAPSSRFKSDKEMVKRIRSACRGFGKAPSRLSRMFPFRIISSSKSRAGKLHKPIKLLILAAGAYILLLLLSHTYTVIHSPGNLPTFALTDLAKITRGSTAALSELSHASTPSAEVEYARGRALERMGRLDEAIETYKQSLKFDPNYSASQNAARRAKAARGQASLQAGLQFYRSGERRRAYDELRTSVEYGMCSAKGYRTLAIIAERRGQLTQAAAYWDSVCKLEPDKVAPHYHAALLFLDTDSLEKAYHHTAKARDLQCKPSPLEKISDEDMQDLLGEVSSACLRAGYFDISSAKNARRIYEKMVWLTRAKNLQPSAIVYASLGRYFERLGDLSSGDRRANLYDQAVTNLQHARKLAPGSPAVNNDLARCLIKRKR